MTKKIAVVFPGQGSQSVGMMSELYDSHSVVRETFSEANDALNFDLWSLIKDGPAETLNQTQNTQPAMLASGIAVWRVLQEQGLAEPAVLAGHSLGEYSALVAAGAIGYSDAIKLVAERGRLMQEAVPEGEGAMAAILGLDDEVVVKICDEAAQGEVAEAVVETFRPIRERTNELLSDPTELDRILADGAARAEEIALSTLGRVYDAIGFLPPVK